MKDESTIPAHGSLSRASTNSVSGTSAPPNVSENCHGHPTRDFAVAVRAPDGEKPCAIVHHGTQWWHVEVEPEALMANPPGASAPPNVHPGCEGHETPFEVQKSHPVELAHDLKIALYEGRYWLVGPRVEIDTVPLDTVRSCEEHGGHRTEAGARALHANGLSFGGQRVIEHEGRWFAVEGGDELRDDGPGEDEPEVVTEQDYLDSVKPNRDDYPRITIERDSHHRFEVDFEVSRLGVLSRMSDDFVGISVECGRPDGNFDSATVKWPATRLRDLIGLLVQVDNFRNGEPPF